MTLADLARTNAIPLEVKKDGLQQRQNGDWVLRLVIQAADMDQRITSAAMGTRFMAALVEVGDDELPKEKSAPVVEPEARQPTLKENKAWRDLPPSQQAAMRRNEPVFAAFLKEEQPTAWREFQDAADCVRSICCVTSRSDLNTNQGARVIWHQLDSQYQAWRTTENVA